MLTIVSIRECTISKSASGAETFLCGRGSEFANGKRRDVIVYAQMRQAQISFVETKLSRIKFLTVHLSRLDAVFVNDEGCLEVYGQLSELVEL